MVKLFYVCARFYFLLKIVDNICFQIRFDFMGDMAYEFSPQVYMIVIKYNAFEVLEAALN